MRVRSTAENILHKKALEEPDVFKRKCFETVDIESSDQFSDTTRLLALYREFFYDIYSFESYIFEVTVLTQLDSSNPAIIERYFPVSDMLVRIFESIATSDEGNYLLHADAKRIYDTLYEHMYGDDEYEPQPLERRKKGEVPGGVFRIAPKQYAFFDDLKDTILVSPDTDEAFNNFAVAVANLDDVYEEELKKANERSGYEVNDIWNNRVEDAGKEVIKICGL